MTGLDLVMVFAVILLQD